MDFNPQEHYRNREQLPPDELEKYYGKQVAWSLDGTRIVASGDDDLQVFEALKAAGIDPETVVFSYVDRPGEVTLGGAFLMEGEEEPA